MVCDASRGAWLANVPPYAIRMLSIDASSVAEHRSIESGHRPRCTRCIFGVGSVGAGITNLRSRRCAGTCREARQDQLAQQ